MKAKMYVLGGVVNTDDVDMMLDGSTVKVGVHEFPLLEWLRAELTDTGTPDGKTLVCAVAPAGQQIHREHPFCGSGTVAGINDAAVLLLFKPGDGGTVNLDGRRRTQDTGIYFKSGVLSSQVQPDIAVAIHRLYIEDDEDSEVRAAQALTVYDDIAAFGDIRWTLPSHTVALLTALQRMPGWAIAHLELDQNRTFASQFLQGLGAVVLHHDDHHALVAVPEAFSGTVHVSYRSDEDTVELHYNGGTFSFKDDGDDDKKMEAELGLAHVVVWNFEPDGRHKLSERRPRWDDDMLEVGDESLKLTPEQITVWKWLRQAGAVIVVLRSKESNNDFMPEHYALAPYGVFKGTGIVIAADDELVVLAMRPGDHGLIAMEDSSSQLRRLPIFFTGKTLLPVTPRELRKVVN